MSDTFFSVSDSQFMAKAISLARQGEFSTSPNPQVGCVFVSNAKVIAQGYHLWAGEGHAEANAIASAKAQGIDLTGTTCYVTLEPCSHFGRTGPCAQALVDAKVARVVVAMSDPNPQVSGRGLELLRRSGIQVDLGLLEKEARQLNPGFLSRVEQKRPFVRLKLACSIDGKIALANGQSQWISSIHSRRDVQLERARSAAILSSASTVLADDASLNVRMAQLPSSFVGDKNRIRQPLRVIVDRQDRLLACPKLKLWQNGGDIVLLQDENFAGNVEPAKRIYVPPSKTWLCDAIGLLATEHEVNDLWVEAGAQLATALLKANLVDHLIVYQAPIVIGGDGISLFAAMGLEKMNQSIALQCLESRRVGPDIKTTYSIKTGA